MPKITYGNSVNPVAKSNSAIRRKQRRKAEAIKRDLVESVIYKALGLKPEKRKVLSLPKRRPASPPNMQPLQDYQQQITKVAEQQLSARYKKRGSFMEFEGGSCCIPEVAKFSAGYRKSENITAR